MDYLSRKINGDLGDMHWSPMSYIHCNVERDDLPVIYRNSIMNTRSTCWLWR